MAKREALQLSKARVADQVSFATAADQRAMTFSGMMIVAASVLIGFSFQGAGSQLTIISASGFLLSAWVSILSAGANNFFPRGCDYQALEPYFSGNFDEDQLLDGLGNLYDRKIKKNRDDSALKSKLYGASKFIAVIASVFAIFGAILAPVPKAEKCFESSQGTITIKICTAEG